MSPLAARSTAADDAVGASPAVTAGCDSRRAATLGNFRRAGRYCARREHLRRTASIALVVGLLLTAINQSDVILSGRATPFTWVKSALNFVVPLFVSNLGLLSGRHNQAITK
jgi:hypothetical protein